MIRLHTFKKDKKNDKVSNHIVAFFRKCCMLGRWERQRAHNLQLSIFVSECRLNKFYIWVLPALRLLFHVIRHITTKKSLWLEFSYIKHILLIKCDHILRVRYFVDSLLTTLISNTNVRFLLWLTFVNNITGLNFPLYSTCFYDIFYFHISW